TGAFAKANGSADAMFRSRCSDPGGGAPQRSIDFPQAGRRQLQQMSVGIAEIDAMPAARPIGAALDGDVSRPEPRLPGRELRAWAWGASGKRVSRKVASASANCTAWLDVLYAENKPAVPTGPRVVVDG